MSHRGFTLVELLAATALTALLMVGVLNVVARLGANELRQPVARNGDAAAALIERDLRLAREVRSGEGFVELRGYSRLDDESLRLTHLPTLVRYEVRAIGGRNWLVRVQSGLDQLTNDRPLIELVAPDIQTVVLDAGDGPAPAARDDVAITERQSSSPAQTDDWIALSLAPTVRLVTVEPDEEDVE